MSINDGCIDDPHIKRLKASLGIKRLSENRFQTASQLLIMSYVLSVEPYETRICFLSQKLLQFKASLVKLRF